MITKIFNAITVSIMLAAFFCSQASAYTLPEPPASVIEPVDPIVEPVDKNYVYIARHNGLDYFLDRFSIKVRQNKISARSWTQYIFPIGENVPAKLSRSTEQTFFTDGSSAYNSSRRKNPVDAIENVADREFMMRCFEVGYENAFDEKFENVSREVTNSVERRATIPTVKHNAIDKGVVSSMANKNLTEVVFILDRSGSMSGMEDDTIGGFNSMLDKQKSVEGTAYLTTVLFDDKMDILHDRVELEAVKPITREEYWVRGSTALLDAVGETIKHIETIHKYARDEDRPAKTIFCITTDGMENASVRYSYRDVKRLIEAKKEQGWEFLFLGADIDSQEVAGRIGIDRNRAANYRKDSRGSGLMYSAFSGAMASFRSAGAVEDAWADAVSEDERNRK